MKVDEPLARTQRARQDLGRWWGISRRLYVVDLLARAVAAFGERRIGTYAAALSYYVMFSFFPLVILVLALFGLVVRDPEAQRSATETILQAFPAGVNLDVERSVESAMRQFSRPNHGVVGLLALVGLIWAASNMFTALRRALNSAFGVLHQRPYIVGKVRDLAGVLAVFGVLIATLLFWFITLLLVALGLILGQSVLPREVVDVFPRNTGTRALALVLSYLNSFFVIILLYRLVPDRPLPLRHLWQGALLAAAGFEVVKFAFGLYLTSFADYQRIYGALGGAVAFLFFVYLIATIVLFVAVLTELRYEDGGADG